VLRNLTLYERLTQLELDMTAVHDAIARLAERVDALESLLQGRDQSHIEAVNGQANQVDDLITKFSDQSAADKHQAPETTADPRYT
jgi:hypothetical protein